MQNWQHIQERLINGGEALTEREFTRVLRLYQQIQAAIPMDFCASLGTLTQRRARLLKEAGVSRYHRNLETARSFFPRICTTHSYESKVETILEAKAAGLLVEEILRTIVIFRLILPRTSLRFTIAEERELSKNH